MEAEYDLSVMKSRRNPYASKLKSSVTIRLSDDVVSYFKGMATEVGVPYQSLINLYLRDCVKRHRQIEIHWPGKSLTHHSSGSPTGAAELTQVRCAIR